MKPLVVPVTLLLASSLAQAQIRTDASLGQAAQTLSGPNYLIPQTLGKVSGSNLFHSFQTFNLASGEAANFSTTSAGISNVISRVTGGSASQINGALRLTTASGAPAFFFINPAGVTFGAGASVDVPGAFHVSTANSLKFADGRFDTDLGKASTLSSAAPEAFGFLGSTRTTVAVRDGVILKPKRTNPISVVGSDVVLDAGTVAAAAGDIRVVAVGTIAGDISLTGPLGSVDGSLKVANAGGILASDFSGVAAGSITVKAGDMQLTRGGYVSSLNASGGNAGNLLVQANRMTLDSEAYVYSSVMAGSTGRGAGITLIGADAIALKGGASVSSDTRSVGAAGSIRVEARDIALAGAAYVSSDTYAGSTGGTGSIALSATDGIALSEKSKVYVSTVASGGAGSVALKATDISLASGAYVASLALEGAANAGTVGLTASRSLSMADDASLFSVSNSTGNAGAVHAIATDITLDTKSKIASTAALGTGNGGSVDVVASGSLQIRNGSLIDSSTYSAGQAGSIKVTASTMTLDTESIISSIASAGSGHAGKIEVIGTERITVSRGGAILSSTFTQGNAGTVLIMGNNISIESGGHVSTASLGNGLGSLGEVGGHGGNINLASTGVVSLSSASLSSTSLTSGRAGTIDVAARNVAMASSRISTSTLQSDGGAISVRGGGLVQLTQSQITTSVAGATGNGGNISISADALAMNTGFIQANTFASNASGGLVNLNLKTLAASGNSAFVGGQSPYLFAPAVFGFNVIQAAAPTGVSGAVQITSPVLDLSGSLGRLNTQVADPAQLGRTPCQTTGGSSLVQAGRGSLTGPHAAAPGTQVALLAVGCP